MAYFTVEGWVALSAVAGVGILMILSVLARRFQRARELHDLRVEATGLRRGYAAKLAALRARERGEIVEVEPVEDEGGMKFPGAVEMRRAA